MDKVALEQGFPVRCHSTNGLHSSSSTCWSYQKDKWPKPGKRPEINGLSEMEKCWIGKYFHIFVFKANNYQLMAGCVFACANSCTKLDCVELMILVKWIPERLCCLSVQFPVCLSVCLCSVQKVFRECLHLLSLLPPSQSLSSQTGTDNIRDPANLQITFRLQLDKEC